LTASTRTHRLQSNHAVVGVFTRAAAKRSRAIQLLFLQRKSSWIPEQVVDSIDINLLMDFLTRISHESSGFQHSRSVIKEPEE
jgi:hypothetical protein